MRITSTSVIKLDYVPLRQPSTQNTLKSYIDYPTRENNIRNEVILFLKQIMGFFFVILWYSREKHVFFKIFLIKTL